MKIYADSNLTEIPNVPEVPPPPPPPPPTKMSRKNLYIAIGLIVVVAAASVFAFIYFMSSGGPSGEGAIIPLSMNYEVGESMEYTITTTVSGMGQQITQTATMQMEIQEFDGEIYTIHYYINIQGYTSLDFTVRMNKTGYIIEGLPPEFQQYYGAFTSIPGYGSYFPKPEMRVGENIQIPLNLYMSGVYITGTMNLEISELTTKTFPNIGTLKVFKLEVSAPNIQATYQGVNVMVTVNGYAYYEYGTCLLIKCQIDESASASYLGQTYTMTMSISIDLTEHNKP
jgi:hypothetical protein